MAQDIGRSDPWNDRRVTDVRYIRRGDNGPLRLALYEQWRSRCYRCSLPTDLIDVEIDHIVPGSAAADRIAELQAAGDLPSNFDVDACENLAPICGRCNREKSAAVFDTLRLGHVLSKARALAPKVRHRVAGFHNATDLEAHLLGVTLASFQDDTSRRQVQEHGEVIVQRIALVDEALADYWSVHEVDSTIEQGPSRFSVPIDSRGRTAVTLLEELLYTQVDDVLSEAVDELFVHALELITDALSAIEVPTGYPTVGEPTMDVCDVVFDSLDFERTGDELTVWAPVAFTISASASVLRDRDDGDGSYELQGDGVVEGSGKVIMTWPVASQRDPGVGSIEIEKVSCDVSTGL